METLHFNFPATKTISRRVHVGVVGSGDLEILLEPTTEPHAEVLVRTGIKGFEDTWKSVLERFFIKSDIAASIKINDFGATPGVVTLRLSQALEMSNNGN